MYRWLSIAALAGLLLAVSGAGAMGLGAALAHPEGGVVGDGTPASCDEAALDEALAGGGNIVFACGGPKTILLTSAKAVTASTTIDGSGLITLNGGETTRLFDVESGGLLALKNITLTRGFGDAADGGAIANHGTLLLEHTTFFDNQTDSNHSGGAIFSDGPVHISNSLFRDNVAGSAGAIFANFANARVTITETTFLGNYAVNSTTGYGGALWVGEDAHLSFRSGVLENNHAQYGGAIYLSPDSLAELKGVFYYVPCPPAATTQAPNQPQACLGQPAAYPGQLLLFRNEASQDGGAIYNEAGALDLNGVQITANQTYTSAVGNGGGLYNAGVLTATQTLFSLNQADNGGALATEGEAYEGRAILVHTYFTLNRADLGGGLFTTSPNTVVVLADANFWYNLGGAGGAIYRANATLVIERAAFEINAATVGGALFTAAQPISNTGMGGVVGISDATFSRNEAQVGGAVWNADLLAFQNVTAKDNSDGVYSQGSGPWQIRNSVLDNEGDNCSGNVPEDQDHNYVTDLTCALMADHSQQGPGLDPMLGPAQYSGEANMVFFMPLPGSPLINQGSTSCSELDQRGAKRPDTCDIGAIEFSGMLPAIWLPLVLR